MDNEQSYRGKISYVNYEKLFATIDYEHNGKKKTVNCKTNVANMGKKPHQFKPGDEVSFQLKLSDRGDKMTAWNVKYLHNTSISLILQKAAIENRFSGYLKKVDDKYFIKEFDSYILFPLKLSPWEVPPAESAENEAISFRLLNIEKPAAIAAELFSHNYTPAYRKALQHFNHQVDIAATVDRISPHGIYVHFFDNQMRAKLPLKAFDEGAVKEGDTVNVIITHLTPERIVVLRSDPGEEDAADRT